MGGKKALSDERERELQTRAPRYFHCDVKAVSGLKIK